MKSYLFTSTVSILVIFLIVQIETTLAQLHNVVVVNNGKVTTHQQQQQLGRRLLRNSNKKQKQLSNANSNAARAEEEEDDHWFVRREMTSGSMSMDINDNNVIIEESPPTTPTNDDDDDTTVMDKDEGTEKGLSFEAEGSESINSGSSSSDVLCKSIIAVGSWRFPPTEQQQQQLNQATITTNDSINNNEQQIEIPFNNNNSNNNLIQQTTNEEFVCELTSDKTVPLTGTVDQLVELRNMLNNGTFISAQSTIMVAAVKEDVDTAGGSKDDGESDGIENIEKENDELEVVTLPPGSITLINNNNDNNPNDNNNIQNNKRRRLNNNNSSSPKKVLIVRITDASNKSPTENAAYISNKFFGTNGDLITMKSGFDNCSFGKFTITNDYNNIVDVSLLSAPGVLDVTIDKSLTSSTQSQIREAALTAIKSKLGIASWNRLNDIFDHVVLIVKECYGDGCDWAAYAYVNHWLSVFQQDNYKYAAGT